MRVFILAMLGAAILLLAACSPDSSDESHSISEVTREMHKAADLFEINRRIVFYNSITGGRLLKIEGRCSVYGQRKRLEVTCKTGANTYKKHSLGLSENVSYFVEQLVSKEVK